MEISRRQDELSMLQAEANSRKTIVDFLPPSHPGRGDHVLEYLQIHQRIIVLTNQCRAQQAAAATAASAAAAPALAAGVAAVPVAAAGSIASGPAVVVTSGLAAGRRPLTNNATPSKKGKNNSKSASST